MYFSGYYPSDSEFAPDAPWNQKCGDYTDLYAVNSSGIEIRCILCKKRITREEWEEDDQRCLCDKCDPPEER